MIHVDLVKAFSTSPREGNPAGIVLETDCDAIATMQSIAREVNLGATAFVSRLDGEHVWIRFFSPKAESSLCVHDAWGCVVRDS